MPLRVLLIGEAGPDRTSLVETLRSQEAFEVIGLAADTGAATDAARSLQPDVAVLAPVPSGDDAIAALAGFCLACPALPVVGIGADASPQHVEKVFRAGLRGYVVQARATADLVRAIREVTQSGLFLSPRASRAVVDRYL
jgi:two-component system nitrate/nitrite response regulator NarL